MLGPVGDWADRTVMRAVAVLVSAVATICTSPIVTAVTTPVALTLAMVGSSDCHVAERSLITPPFASVRVATSGSVAPGVSVAVSRLSTTVFTGGTSTVSTAVPVTLLLVVATMVASPGRSAVASPDAEISKDIMRVAGELLNAGRLAVAAGRS